jgi:SAM-dependent methyltransferase
MAMGPLEQVVADYPVWWVDFLGEHNHMGGRETTRWLLDHSRLAAGDHMLDAGCFVGAAARAAALVGIRAVGADANADFLAAGKQLTAGEAVTWVAAATQRLPFRDGVFESVWSLDAPAPPRELSRVAAARATLCLCTEVPNDSRGGVESYFEEWSGFGWQLAAHKQISLDTTQTWRRIEAELVARHPHFETRYGPRGYRAQLDMSAAILKSYERGETGHGLFVFARG